MNQFKKGAMVSAVWNVVMILLLFFQSAIFIGIIKKQFFPTVEFLIPLFNGTFVEFIKERAIMAGVIIGIIIILELLLFFVVNGVFAKKMKKAQKNSEQKDLKYLVYWYRAIIIYMAAFIVGFLGFLVFSAVGIGTIAGELDLTMNNKAISTIYDAVMNANIQQLADINNLVETITNTIKNSDMVRLVEKVLDTVNGISVIQKAWYIVGYILLAVGLFFHGKLFIHRRKNNQKEIKATE